MERTWCDLAACGIGERSLRRILHDLWRHDRTSPERVAACLNGLGRPRGAATLRRILAEWDPRLADTWSPIESEAFHALQRGRCPLPEVNWIIFHGDGSRRYVLDLAWPPLRYAVEVNSKRHHSISPDVHRDACKRAELEEEGWRIDVVEGNEVLNHPAEFAARMKATVTSLQRSMCPQTASSSPSR